MTRLQWTAIMMILSMMMGPAWAVPYWEGRGSTPVAVPSMGSYSYCLSWRLGVEVNNVCAWRTVPAQCLLHIQAYLINGGQYEQDLNLITAQIRNYLSGIQVGDDGMDAWVLDVDETCISNVQYYRGKRYGCDPYDPAAFRAWAMEEASPAVPATLHVFKELVEKGLKVFLVTGRDEEALGRATWNNLAKQGFIGYERLIMRGAGYRGESAVRYKSEVRKELVREGYRIWGNVGDQWSDLVGECVGDRTFKLPNPMYYVP